MSEWEGLSPPYGTIVADPPWPYNKGPLPRQRASGMTNFIPYSTMTLDDIARMPVVDLAAVGAHLYLWTTNRFLWAARDVALGWGFVPTQVLVWCKPPTGKAGGKFAIETEFIVYARRSIREKREVQRAGRLIRQAREAAGLNRAELHRAVRGGKPTGIVFRWEDDDSMPGAEDWDRLVDVLPALADVPRPMVETPAPLDETRIDRNWWEWPRGSHSAKPPQLQDLAEQVSPGPYCELFARDQRLGWDSWGHGYEHATAAARGGAAGIPQQEDGD